MSYRLPAILLGCLGVLMPVGVGSADDDVLSLASSKGPQLEPKLILSPAERQHLDEFGAALRRFRTLSYSDFVHEYGTRASGSVERVHPAGASSEAALGYEPLDAEYLQLIRKSFPLSEDQERIYRRNGFVVMNDPKLTSFLNSFYDVYRKDLPVYISVDSILDALHLSFDRMLLTLEEDILTKELDQMLSKMEGGISTLEATTGGSDFEVELDDAAFWICTARSLLAGQQAGCSRQIDNRVRGALDLIASASIAEVDWFGSKRKEDFSLFTPRGHYTKSEQLKRYFQAMVWCQRIGMDFTKGQRQVSVAYLLTKDLYATGAIENWKLIEGVIGTFIGASDSLGPDDMDTFAESAEVRSVVDFRDQFRFNAFLSLAAKCGAGHQRINSQILVSNPNTLDGFTPIPPSFCVLGQRFTVDSYIFTNVVFDRVRPAPRGAKRVMPSPLDAMFVLGNRTAGSLLHDEIKTYGYYPNLAALNWIVSSYDESFWRDSLYNVWLSSLRQLSCDTSSPTYPSVMQTDVWQRRMLHAQLASWSQLRHDSVLYAEPSDTAGECDYPDGWVDPYPEFYRALADYAEVARSNFSRLGVQKREIDWYLKQFESGVRMLEEIARAELEGRELSSAQKSLFEKWLFLEGSSAAVFSGRYPDMIFRVQNSLNYVFGAPMRGAPIGEPFDPTVADIHTDPDTGEVLQVAVGRPNLMLISIKNRNGNRAFIGPVFSYYQFRSQGLNRMTDADWKGKFDTSAPPARPAWVRDFVR